VCVNLLRACKFPLGSITLNSSGIFFSPVLLLGTFHGRVLVQTLSFSRKQGGSETRTGHGHCSNIQALCSEELFSWHEILTICLSYWTPKDGNFLCSPLFSHLPYFATRKGTLSAIAYLVFAQWLNGSTFHRLRAEMIIIKYLAAAWSEVNFTCQFCSQSVFQ
jgi:hypothetical protein